MKKKSCDFKFADSARNEIVV